MKNKRGRLYYYINSSFNYSDPVWFNYFRVRVSLMNFAKVGITLSAFCVGVIIICICSVIQSATGEWYRGTGDVRQEGGGGGQQEAGTGQEEQVRPA